MLRYCFLALLIVGFAWGQKPYDLLTLVVTPEVGVVNDLEMGPAGSILGQRGGQLFHGSVKEEKLELRPVEGANECGGVRGGRPGTAFAQCGAVVYWLGSSGSLEKRETGGGRVVWVEEDGSEYWVLRGAEEAGLGIQFGKRMEDERTVVLERYGRDGAKRGETVVVRGRGGEAAIGYFVRSGVMVAAGNQSQLLLSSDGGKSFVVCADGAVRRKDRKTGKREDAITDAAVNERGVMSVVLQGGEFVRLDGLAGCPGGKGSEEKGPEVTVPDAEVPESIVKVVVDTEGRVFARQSGRWVYWQQGKRWQKVRESGVEAILRGPEGRVMVVRVED